MCQVKLKLILLNAIANISMDLESACPTCEIAVSTGYLWIRKWNEEGYEGIKDKPNPGGRPPKLDEENLEELRAELKKKDYWLDFCGNIHFNFYPNSNKIEKSYEEGEECARARLPDLREINNSDFVGRAPSPAKFKFFEALLNFT
jgi:hypothetical protein